MAKEMKAVVVQNQHGQIFVEFGYNDDEGQLDRTREHWVIPMDEERAWAVADAYNFPQYNKNDWRNVG